MLELVLTIEIFSKMLDQSKQIGNSPNCEGNLVRLRKQILQLSLEIILIK